MKKIAIFGVAALVLASCGIARQMEQDELAKKADAALVIARASCEARLNAKEFRSTLARTECDNEALIIWGQARPIPDMDLLRLKTTKMAVLADDLDHGKITVQQFKAGEAQIASDGMSMMQNRFAQRDLVAAARDQANAAQDMAGPRHCQRVGNGVTCY